MTLFINVPAEIVYSYSVRYTKFLGNVQITQRGELPKIKYSKQRKLCCVRKADFLMFTSLLIIYWELACAHTHTHSTVGYS